MRPCTPAREGDDPAPASGSIPPTLPGRVVILRARITGEPPGLYERIGPGPLQALRALSSPR